MSTAPSSSADLDGSPAGGKRAQTKLANRAALLDAAREVFTEMGYGAASIRDIVRRTDLASGTFYNYFPDKASIFAAVVDERTAELRSRLHDVRVASHGLDAVVREGFAVYFSFIVEDQALFGMLRRNAGTIRELFGTTALEAGILELLADLREVASRGELPGSLDLSFLAAAMGGVAFEVGIRLTEQDEPDVAGAATFASELFLGGIGRLAG